jgi:hypothetical protein
MNNANNGARGLKGCYAVLNGLLLRGGYRTADLRAAFGDNFRLELGFVRRIRDAMISPDAYPRFVLEKDHDDDLAAWENEGGSIKGRRP